MKLQMMIRDMDFLEDLAEGDLDVELFMIWASSATEELDDKDDADDIIPETPLSELQVLGDDG